MLNPLFESAEYVDFSATILYNYFIMLIILSLLIFIRPFISSLTYSYTNTFYSLLLLFFLCLWVISKKIEPEGFAAVKYPLICFSFALIVSTLLSVNRLNSLTQLYQYANGMLIFLVCASFNHEQKKRLIRVIALTGIIASALAIYQYFFGFARLTQYAAREGINDPFVMDYISRKRVFLPFVTPNILAGYLAMTIPVILVYKYRIWLVIPMAFALFLTKSLGGIAVIPVILIVYFLLDEKIKTKKALLALSGIIIAIAIIAILRFSAQKLHQHPFFSTAMRLDYWKQTLRIIAYAPLKGVGPGNFNLGPSRYAHNSYLQLWAETGIFGLITFLWFMARAMNKGLEALRESAKRREIACLFCASLAFLLHNLVDFSFFLPEVSLIWWAILGLLYSFIRQPLPES